MPSKKICVAIDGPAGAGKSTVARLVANALGYIYIDTGAMYRAVTWKTIQAGVQLDQREKIIQIAEQIHIELVPEENGQLVFVDGQEVTSQIRSIEVSQRVPQIAQIEEVRNVLVHKQKQMSAMKGVVMDGRDITTRVLPDAEVKIYLTASVEERARRRFLELNDQNITLEQLEREIAKRDEMDRNRPISPLMIAEDAVVIDSTALSIYEVVEKIVDLCRTKMSGA